MTLPLHVQGPSADSCSSSAIHSLEGNLFPQRPRSLQKVVLAAGEGASGHMVKATNLAILSTGRTPLARDPRFVPFQANRDTCGHQAGDTALKELSSIATGGRFARDNHLSSGYTVQNRHFDQHRRRSMTGNDVIGFDEFDKKFDNGLYRSKRTRSNHVFFPWMRHERFCPTITFR